MMASGDRLRVFVSSKMMELAPERRAIKDALTALRVDAWVFEDDAGARPESIQQVYLAEVETADLYVGLFWRGAGDRTIEEYEHARKLQKDCLIYEKRFEIDGVRDPQLQHFLDRIGDVERGVTPRWFNTVEDLERFVQDDVDRWRTRTIRKRRTASIATFTAPALPDRYVERHHTLEALKTRALVTGAGRPRVGRLALLGLGGSGKSTLAMAFAHDPDVQRTFRDGILWAEFGKTPDVRQRLADWGRLLSDPTLAGAGYADEQTGTSQLRRLLQEQACLLIVDDVWDPKHLKPFLVGGAQCQMLITTRMEVVADDIGAEKIALAGMSDDEALALLEKWTGPIASAERDAARLLAREFEGLPLALELASARVEKAGSWTDARQRWQDRGLDSLARRRRATDGENKLKQSFMWSLEALPADGDVNDRLRYLELGCLHEATAFSAQTAAVLWGCETGEALEFLIDLSEQSLVQREHSASQQRFRLHSLVREFVIDELGDKWLVESHAKLVEGYRQRCGAGWATGPNDGYYLEHLAYHLVATGSADELKTLLIDSAEWMEVKFRAFLTDESTARDLDLARGSARDPLSVLELAMARHILGRRASVYTPDNLKTLVLLDRGGEAEAHARLVADPYQRVDALLALYEVYAELGQPASAWLDEALAATRGAPTGSQAVDRLAQITEILATTDAQREASIFHKAESAARSLQDVSAVTRALMRLCEASLATGNHERARRVALTIAEAYWKVDALCSIAVNREGGHHPDAAEAMDEAVSTLRRESPAVVVQLLKFIGDLASCGSPRASTLLEESQACINEESDPRRHTAQDAKYMVALAQTGRLDEALRRFEDLEEIALPSDLAPLVQELGRAGRFDDAWHVIDRLREPFWQQHSASRLATFLAKADHGDEVEAVAQQLAPIEQGEALGALVSVLIERSQFEGALRVAGMIEDADYRSESADRLALAWARAGRPGAAALLDTIKTRREQERRGYEHLPALCAVAVALYEAGDVNYGRFLAAAEETVEDGDTVLDGPAQLAGTLVLAGEYERAFEFLDEDEGRAARATIVVALQARASGDRRSAALFDSAARLVDDDDAQGRQVILTLKTIAERADRDLRTFARTFWGSLFDSWSGDLQRDLALAIVTAGDLEEAERTVRATIKESGPIEGLAALIGPLHDAGDPHAQALLGEIAATVRAWDGYRAEYGVVALAEAYAGAGAFREAAECANLVSSYDGRRMVRRKIARAHARSRRFGQAMDELLLLSVDDCLEEVAAWGPYLNEVRPGFSAVALREMIRIAGWLRPDWRDLVWPSDMAIESD